MIQEGSNNMLKTQKFLIHAVARLDEERVLSLVKQGLDQGIHPFTLLEEARMGMERVGERYNRGTYFLADLIMAAEIFKNVLTLVLKIEGMEPKSEFPPIVFGTVEEDIHDIGKNITIGVLKGKGFQVCDLGVNVPPRVFMDALNDTGSRILCLSGLITTAYDSMKKTVNMLEKEGLRSRVIVIIGGLVNESIRRYTGADYWTTDCARGTEMCKNRLMNNAKNSALSS